MTRPPLELLVMSAVGVVLACGVGAGGYPSAELEPVKVRSVFLVSPTNMCSPVGFIVLVRDRDDVLAIKFLDPKRGNKEGTGTAHYTTYLPAKGGTDFHAGSRREDGVASIKGWSGVDPLIFQRGEFRLRAGRFRLVYGFPTCLDFLDTPYEFAPTPWTNVEDVDPGATYLSWYRNDPMSERSLEIAPESLRQTQPK